MDWKSHRLFGRLIASRYEQPIEGYLEWTIMPDMKYFKEYWWRHVVFHRMSLHGVDNIEAVIEHGRQFPQYVEYDEALKDYIDCLIMTHNYLDLFNFIIFPSWPASTHTALIRSQLPRIITLRTIEAPDGLEKVLTQMVRQHRDPKDLYKTMLYEYLALPDIGWYMRQILELYE